MEISFMDYWNTVDREMLAIYDIDTYDAGIEAHEIAEAQDAGWTPNQFVVWFGEIMGLRKSKPGVA